MQVLFIGCAAEAFINGLLRIVEILLLVSAVSSLVPSSAKQTCCLPYRKNMSVTTCIEALKSCAMMQTFMQDPCSIQRLVLLRKCIHNKRNFCSPISEIICPKNTGLSFCRCPLAPQLSRDIPANENYVRCYQKNILYNRIGKNECVFGQADSGISIIDCDRAIRDIVQSCNFSVQKQAVVSIYSLVDPEEIGFRFIHNVRCHYQTTRNQPRHPQHQFPPPRN